MSAHTCPACALPLTAGDRTAGRCPDGHALPREPWSAPTITPGPWRVVQIGTRPYIVADTGGICDTDSGPDDSTANALAIAAVPDLIAALAGLVDGNMGQPSAVDVPALDPARAALRKAGVR